MLSFAIVAVMAVAFCVVFVPAWRKQCEHNRKIRQQRWERMVHTY